MKKINYGDLNEILRLSRKLLKLGLIFFSIIGTYVVILILKEWQLVKFILSMFNLLSPLFIGLVIAWLLSPLIKYLELKGVKRLLGTTLIYIVLLGFIYYTMTALIPIFLQQINDFLKIVPTIISESNKWLEHFLSNFKELKIIDMELIKGDLINYLSLSLGTLTTEIPMIIINFTLNLFSFLGVFILGLVIGFYLLLSLNFKFMKQITFKHKQSMLNLLGTANQALFSYLKGALLIAFIIFLSSTLVLVIVGVETPLFLGFICGLTNLIPYLGPFIGGALAALVAFTSSFSKGILTILLITILQSLESIILQPLVMSKTMKLHPVTILVGLLIFGYFLGIIGLIIATPLIAMIKAVVIFLNKKYQWV